MRKWRRQSCEFVIELGDMTEICSTDFLGNEYLDPFLQFVSFDHQSFQVVFDK
jgi:hypothetical protein